MLKRHRRRVRIYRLIKNLNYCSIVVLILYISTSFSFGLWEMLLRYGVQLVYLIGVFGIISIAISIILISLMRFQLGSMIGMLGTIEVGLLLLLKALFYPYNYFRIPVSLYLRQALYHVNVFALITGIFCLFGLLIIYGTFLYLNISQNKGDRASIINIIKDLGTKYTRLEIREISEKCNKDPGLILKIVKCMIERQEVFARYFTSSKAVAFNQKANISKIEVGGR